jgi:hypothetical protein
MKKWLFIFTALILAGVTSSSLVVHAESPFVVPSTKKLRIDFFSVPEWIEVNRIEGLPEQLLLKLVDQKGNETPIASFSQDGPASPELVSIFKNKVNSHEILFVILKWHYYLSGVNTEGYYYEVHAYQAQRNKGRQEQLSENRQISELFGSGFDGKQEGKEVHFRFKDAPSVRRALPLIRGKNSK